MLRVLATILFIFSAFTFKFSIFDWGKKKALKNKLPSYLGKGYHLLKGNPFTDKID